MPVAPIRLLKNAYGGLSANVWLLSLVTFINRSGTMVIPFLTVYLTVEKHFTFEQAGLIMSTFGAGSLLGSWLGGWLTDKIGFYNVQVWTMAISGFLFFGLGQLDTFWTLCVGVFILSTVGDAFRPANMTAVSTYSKPENLTRSLSLVRMAINLGWSIGPAIGGFFAASVGYKWLFIADGTTCILAAIMLRIFLSPRKSNLKETNKDSEVDIIHRPPYKDPPFMVFIFMIALVAICFMQFLYTLPVYFKTELGLSEFQIGLLLALNGLIIGLTEVTLVYILENRFPKLVLCALGAFIICLAYLSLNLNPHAAILAVVCMSLLTVGEMFNFPFANSFALTRSTSKTRGQYMSFYTMAFAAASIVSPTMGLYLAEHWGFQILWYFMAGLALVATFGILSVSRMETVRS